VLSSAVAAKHGIAWHSMAMPGRKEDGQNEPFGCAENGGSSQVAILKRYPLVLTNIAMENCPFIDGLPGFTYEKWIKMVDLSIPSSNSKEITMIIHATWRCPSSRQAH